MAGEGAAGEGLRTFLQSIVDEGVELERHDRQLRLEDGFVLCILFWGDGLRKGEK